MTETKRRIKELQALLPNVRERVISVALLLALSMTMMASASYAWYTLSFAPEATEITTTVSSNGSLEVALAGLYDDKGNLLEPLASMVGDSYSADGQTTQDANLTWGNLIDLSNNYGLESLVLRPATLLDKAPAFLASVDYGSDGRYEGSAIDFGLTSWKELDGKYSFAVTENMLYGVRAISSVTYPDGKGALQEKLDDAEEIFQEAYRQYNAIVNNETYITTIQNLVQVFIDGSVAQYLDGSTDPIVCTNYIAPLYAMIKQLYEEPVCKMGDALAAMANAKMSLVSNTYTPYTRETLLTATEAELEENGATLTYLAEYKSLHSKVFAQLLAMEDLKNRSEYEDIYWEDTKDADGNVKKGIVDVVDELISINTVTVNGLTISKILSQGESNLLSFATSLPDPTPIKVYNGILWECERYTGCRMNARIHYYIKAYGIKAVDKDALISTSLTSTDTALYYLAKAEVEEEAASGGQQFKGTMIAGDTYGMVLDIWVRTNAANSYLTLDGLLDVEIYYEQSIIKLMEDNTMVSREEWIYTHYTGETTDLEGTTIKLTAAMSVYQIPEDLDGDGVIQEYTKTAQGKEYTVYEGYFYNSDTNAKVYVIGEDGASTEEPLTYENVEPKLIEKKNIIGFNGSNRVDDDFQDLLSSGEMSATQGSGSCYIFYANTPEESASALQLLSHLSIAFFDANGNRQAVVGLDVENVFADGGKYVVPMVIKESNFKTDSGEYYITDLNQNEAKLLNVVVFLDGEGLENSMVMASDSIQGKMNLQFASTAKLESMFNTDLSLQSVSLSASVDVSKFEYTGAAQSTQLTAAIEGVTPGSVQAVFQRKINASQGSRMDPVDLTLVQGEGWIGYPSFTMPGTYVLKSLWIDGVEYELPSEIVVTVEGLNISYCAVSGDSVALTADNSVTRTVTVRVDADASQQPKTMAIRFLDENDKFVSANLFYDSEYGWWTGDVTFNSSGSYTLTYVIMDGTYFELSENYQRQIDTYLGLRAQVRLRRDGGLTFPFEGQAQEIGIAAQIVTDTGEPLEGLTGVTLTYGMRGNPALEKGLNSELTWDGSAYVGTFNVAKIGIFNFAQITAGNNVITVAESAPVITVQAVDPPQYLGSAMYYENESTADFVIMDNDATVYYGVNLDNASGAERFEAVMTDPTGKSWTISMLSTDSQINDDGTGVYKFVIPDTTSGNKNGLWTVTEIRVYGVYDREGNYYGDDMEGVTAVEPYYRIDESIDEDYPYQFTIIDEFDISVDNALVLNNAFMEAVKLEDEDHNSINVSIDLVGVTMPEGLEIDNVVLTLEHITGSSQAYGNYTYTGTYSYENIVCDLVYDNASVKWLVSSDEVAYLAGTYTYTLTFDIVGENFRTRSYEYKGEEYVNDEAQKIIVLEVYSASPTVTVTGVSPGTTASHRIYLASRDSDDRLANDSDLVTGAFNRIMDSNGDGNNDRALVYIYAGDSWALNAYLPSVTLQLSGIAGGFSFTTDISFANDCGAADVVYSFNQDTLSVTNSIGYKENGTTAVLYTWYPIIKPAGTQTVPKITVTDSNGVIYEVTLAEPVTIDQPQYPPYVEYTIDDNRYASDAVTGRVYSTNGETVVLPDIENWTNYGEATALSTKSYPDPTTSSAGTYYYDRGWWRYYTYTRTKYTQSCTVESRIDNVTYKLQWNVNGALYEPGEEVAISGAVSITAVVTEVSREYVRTDSVTYTKTWYMFTQTGKSEKGTQIGFEPSSSTKYDASNNVYDESETVS